MDTDVTQLVTKLVLLFKSSEPRFRDIFRYAQATITGKNVPCVVLRIIQGVPLFYTIGGIRLYRFVFEADCIYTIGQVPGIPIEEPEGFSMATKLLTALYMHGVIHQTSEYTDSIDTGERAEVLGYQNFPRYHEGAAGCSVHFTIQRLYTCPGA